MVDIIISRVLGDSPQRVEEGDLILYYTCSNPYRIDTCQKKFLLGVFNSYEPERNRMILSDPYIINRAEDHKKENHKLVKKLPIATGSYFLISGKTKAHIQINNKIPDFLEQTGGFKIYAEPIRKLEKPYSDSLESLFYLNQDEQVNSTR